MTKLELFQIISNAADYGNICLFVGAGFSKAVFEETTIKPPTWLELLQKIYTEKNIRFDESELLGKSCPEIASYLVSKMMSFDENLKYEDAIKSLKTIVCREVQYIPNENECKTFAPLLKAFNPEYIITTNYDLVLEAILPDIGYPLAPTDCLKSPRKYVPIYHLHGICQTPSSIVITNEDYIQLFRPNDYRLEKLALIMKESTVIFLGYAIGDQNVKTSIDWANNIYKGLDVENAKKIQIVYKSNPSNEVYEIGNMMTIETNKLSLLLNEFYEFRENKISEAKKESDNLLKLREAYLSGDKTLIDAFISDENKRKIIIKKSLDNRVDLLVPFQFFLKNVYNQCWINARPKGAFKAYNDMTKIILDLLIVMDLRNPSFFITVANEFSKFAEYIGNKYYGQSFSAAETWNTRKLEIPKNVCKELKKYGFNHSFYIEQLVDEILEN